MLQYLIPQDIAAIFSILRLQITGFDNVLFLGFAVVSIIFYYLSGRKKLVLLAVCILFYLSFSVSVTKMIGLLALLNYILGILIHIYKKRFILILGIILNLGILFYFKYANFFISNINLFRPGEYSFINYIVIPLGISFFTFEFIHYLVDISRGKKPVFNIISFYIFAFYFPTLIAGPIKRYEQFIPQLTKKRIDFDLLEDGTFLVVKGLFKKVVIANSLAIFASQGFDHGLTSGVALLGLYAFAFQIYFDFSGYTDIGRGISSLLNIKVNLNFMQPYYSGSIQEFWRRWHMSLMSWLRDYIYIPLGGSRAGRFRRLLNISMVFLISGIWHGAAWHYVIWGAYNAALMIIGTFVKPLNFFKKIPFRIIEFLSVILTFHLVLLGWIFFRAESVGNALDIIKKVLVTQNLNITIDQKFVFIFIILILYFGFGYLTNFIKKHNPGWYPTIRILFYSLSIILIILNFSANEPPFIYFKF